MDGFDLLAYGDGRLSRLGARKRAVEARLRHNPQTADALSQDRVATEALRKSLDGVLDEPVPERLLTALDQYSPRWNGGGWPVSMVLGVMAAFVLGWVLSGGFDRSADAPDYAAFLDTASEEAAALKPAVASRVAAPDISRFGLVPVAADEIAVKDRRLRRIVYLGPHGASLELLASPLAPKPVEPIRVSKTPSGAAAYWTDNGVAYRVAADLPVDRLRAIAGELRGKAAKPALKAMTKAAPESVKTGAMPLAAGSAIVGAPATEQTNNPEVPVSDD